MSVRSKSDEAEDLEYLRKKYGKKFVKAYTTVLKGRVTKVILARENICLWIVYSSKRKRFSVVIPGILCTCLNFYNTNIAKNLREPCYHMLAQIIAERRKLYHEVVVEDEVEFIKKLLRHLLYSA